MSGFVTAVTLVLVLAVKRPPMITTHPESVTVFSVEDLVMSCEASGNPSPMLVSAPTYPHRHRKLDGAVTVVEEPSHSDLPSPFSVDYVLVLHKSTDCPSHGSHLNKG